ncbi:MAG: secondary thiamine-phosphate synthase enzyme YjbQ [Natrialbaceae archaeon]|nr:secondary thiamine-phosphate synthase enzyme YjbQ [Natrialbaceae archaeon]
MEDMRVSTPGRQAIVDITDEIDSRLPAAVDDGVCTVFVKHTTAALIVQEAESRLLDDIDRFLTDLVPESGHAHDEIDDNAAAHLRATVLGPAVTVPIEAGSIDLGTWQSILLVELDGPRTRTVTVTTGPGD